MDKIDIDEWREKRLQELQSKYNSQEQVKEQIVAAQQYEQLKKILFLQMLDEKARERLSNIKVANPVYAMQLEQILIQLIQAGQIRGRITEEQLINLLKKMKEQKREYRILK